jgi:hypothetical protein
MKKAKTAVPAPAETANAPEMYRLQDILGIIGIPLGLASNWSRRYPGAAIEHSGRGKGRRRMVDAELVIRFALMKTLTDVGIPPLDALGTAQAILREIAETKRHEPFVIWFYPDGHAIALPARVAPEPGADASLRIEVRQIIDRVRKALDALAAAEATGS